MASAYNQKKEVSLWARFAIERFQKELKKKKIGKSGDLHRSFEHHVQGSGDDVQSVMITFNMYGRFRDMGVGRGLKAYERLSNKGNQMASKYYGADVDYVHRGAKRWFNKPKMAQIFRLREILAESLGNATVFNVQEGMKDYTQYRVNL